MRAVIAGIVDPPESPVPRIDDHSIAHLELEVLALQRCLEILYRDLVLVAEHLNALERGDIEQHTAREEAARVFHAELGKTAARHDLVDLEAVVVAAANRLKAEAVDLRTDLTEFGHDDLLIRAARIGSGGPARALDLLVLDAIAIDGMCARSAHNRRDPDCGRQAGHCGWTVRHLKIPLSLFLYSLRPSRSIVDISIPPAGSIQRALGVIIGSI